MDTIFKFNQRLDSSDFIPKSIGGIGTLIADDFFGVTSGGGSGVLGYTTIGASEYTTGKGVLCKFEATENGSITQLTAHIKSTGTNNFKFVIYSDNAGSPDALLAQSSGDTFDTTYSWHTLAISYNFTNGEVLHFGLISDSYIVIHYDAGSTNQFTEILPEFNYPTPTDPASVNFQADAVLSIYADYTTSGGGSYTLTASSGSYVLSGQSVGLTAQRRLSLVQGAYTYSGQSVGLGISRRLTAVQGAYSLSGQTLNFKRGLVLPLVRGLYSLSGQNLGVIRQLTLSLTNGSYVLSGQNLTFVYVPVVAYVIVCHQGAYTLTRQNLGLTKQSRLSFNQGSYSFSGKNLSFSVTRYLALTQGNYTFTNNGISLIASRRLLLTKGDYSFTGQSVNLLTYRLISLNKGNYNLTGQDLNFTYFYIRKRYFITS